jgi:hypothetical protein
VTLTLFMLVSIKRTVLADVAYDGLFGLPLPYISDNYSFSFHYDVYVLALLFDLLIYLVLTIIFFIILSRLGLRLKTHSLLVSVGFIISLLWITFFILITQDSSFKWTNDIKVEIIDRKLYFGIYPSNYPFLGSCLTNRLLQLWPHLVMKAQESVQIMNQIVIKNPLYLYKFSLISDIEFYKESSIFKSCASSY